jgi:signal transduction histidine kinase
LALLSQAILIRGKKHKNTTSLTPNISAEIDLLQKNIDGLVSKALDQGITSESLRSAAIHIRNQIESNLKPLQHKLWNRTLSAKPKYRFTLLLEYAIVNPNYNVWRILFTFSMLNMINLGGFLTLNQGISILIINNLLVMFWVKVHQKFNKHTSRSLFPNATLLLCSSATLGTLSSTSIEILRGAPWPLSATVSLSVILLTLIVLESMFSLREQDRASLLRILEKGIIRELEDSPSSSHHSNIKVASYLHNSYQSELYGIIAQLQLAAARPDDSDTKAILEKLGAVINRSVSEDFINFQKSPSERLERMIESWKGLVDIQIHFSDEHRIDKDRIGLVVEVIEEAVANAVRLGNADKIVVDTFLDKGYLKIIIEDNGQGPIAGRKGLGGQLLDRFALEEWNLEKTSVGTKLTVII